MFLTIQSLETLIIHKFAQLPLQTLRHPEWTLIRFQYIAAKSTWNIESNNLHERQIENIQVVCIGQVPLQASWLRCGQKKVYSFSDIAYKDDISGSDGQIRLTTVTSIVRGLNQRRLRHCDHHHCSSLTYWPCWTWLNQCKELFNHQFRILDDEKTLQRCGNESSRQPKEAIRTCPYPEKYGIISGWLMHSPSCPPGLTNHMNCLLVELNRCHQNYWCIAASISNGSG